MEMQDFTVIDGRKSFNNNFPEHQLPYTIKDVASSVTLGV